MPIWAGSDAVVGDVRCCRSALVLIGSSGAPSDPLCRRGRLKMTHHGSSISHETRPKGAGPWQPAAAISACQRRRALESGLRGLPAHWPRWNHLRLCMTCGHVGCCDSSPNRHATAHWHAHPDHPVIRSFEPEEDWWWCYEDPAQLRRTRRPARAVTPNQEVTDAAVPATLSPDGRLAGRCSPWRSAPSRCTNSLITRCQGAKVRVEHEPET